MTTAIDPTTATVTATETAPRRPRAGRSARAIAINGNAGSITALVGDQTKAKPTPGQAPAKRARVLADAAPVPIAPGYADAVAIAPKPPSKRDRIVALLKRDNGASLDELIAATGWLPHTTRAALTGLRKAGKTLDRNVVEGVSRYRIAG